MIGRFAVWALGWLWWTILPIRKSAAIEALSAAFPETDPTLLRTEVGLVAWQYVELLLGIRAEVEGTEHLAGGVIALVGHGSAWDMALVSIGTRAPVTIFVKPPANRLAAWIVTRLRGASDVELLPPEGSMTAAYAALERGRSVLFVQDQRHNRGIPVPFFGRPAWTSPAFAAMAWKTRRPIVGIWQRREANGKHRMWVIPLSIEIPEAREAAIQELTALSQRYYEDRIREAPAQWWWLHRRWKVGSQEAQPPAINQRYGHADHP